MFFKQCQYSRLFVTALFLIFFHTAYGSPAIESENDEIAKASCQLYAVHDEKRNNTQFFAIDGLKVNLLGQLHLGKDIEALTIQPETDQLFAASGKDGDKQGYLYHVNAVTGELIEIGPTGYRDINGIAFNPQDKTLWGWAVGNGLIKINPTTAESSLQIPFASNVEDIVWNNTGSTLYAVANNTFYSYTPATETIQLLDCTLATGEIEAIEMMPGGSDQELLYGTHNDKTLSIHKLNIQTCETAEVNISTKVEGINLNDVEGIALPVSACANDSYDAPLTDAEITQHTKKLLSDPALVGTYPIIYTFKEKIPASQIQTELEQLGLSPIWVQALRSDITLATYVALGTNIEQAVADYLQHTSEKLPDEIQQEILADASIPLVQAVVAFGDVDAHRQFSNTEIVYGSIFVLPGYDPRLLVMFPIEDTLSTQTRRQVRKTIDPKICPKFEAKPYDEKKGIWPWRWPIEGEVIVHGPKWRDTSEAFVYAGFKFPNDMEVMPCDPDGIKAQKDSNIQFGMEFDVEFDDFGKDEPDFGSLSLEMFENNIYTSTDIDDLDNIKDSQQPANKSLGGWLTNLPKPYLDPECIGGDATEHEKKCAWWNPLDEHDKNFKTSVGILDGSGLEKNGRYWFLVEIGKPTDKLSEKNWPIRVMFSAEVTHVDRYSDSWFDDTDKWYRPDDPNGNPRWMLADGSTYEKYLVGPKFESFHKYNPKGERNWTIHTRIGVPTNKDYTTKFYAPSWEDIENGRRNLNFLRTFGDSVFSCRDKNYAITCISDERVPTHKAKPIVYEINRFDTQLQTQLSVEEPLKTEYECHIRGAAYIKGNMWISSFNAPTNQNSLIGIGYNTGTTSFGHDVTKIVDGTQKNLQCSESGCIRDTAGYLRASKPLLACNLFSDVTVEITGPGDGSVKSMPHEFDSGIDCDSSNDESACQHLFIRATNGFVTQLTKEEVNFLKGDPITLTATAADGSVFAGWEGACESFKKELSCTLPKENVVHAIARFETASKLNLSVELNGLGHVNSNPTGIDCATNGSSSCEHTFTTSHIDADNISVTLTAVADEGSVFAGWTGPTCGYAGTNTSCTVTGHNQTIGVSAKFDVDDTPTNVELGLHVGLTGDGAGQVLSTPAGIDCSTDADASCQHTFSGDGNFSVTLKITPNEGSVFAGWSGTACEYAGFSPECTITTDTSQTIGVSVSAKFMPGIVVKGTQKIVYCGTIVTIPRTYKYFFATNVAPHVRGSVEWCQKGKQYLINENIRTWPMEKGLLGCSELNPGEYQVPKLIPKLNTGEYYAIEEKIPLTKLSEEALPANFNEDYKPVLGSFQILNRTEGTPVYSSFNDHRANGRYVPGTGYCWFGPGSTVRDGVMLPPMSLKVNWVADINWETMDTIEYSEVYIHKQPLQPCATKPTHSKIRVDISEQLLYLYCSYADGKEEVKTYPVSTAKAGIGNKKDSNKTPLGRHKIQKKIGDGEPIGRIFKGRQPTKGKITKMNVSKKDYVLTRIMRLKGLEEGKNSGKDESGTVVDSYERFIYIHGTPAENKIGTPASLGCVRMYNSDVIDLFDLVNVGTEVNIEE